MVVHLMNQEQPIIMKNFDNIEEFIHDHREDFEKDIPDDKIWDHVASRLDSEGQERWSKPEAPIRHLSRAGKRWISAAAVLLLCVSLAAFVRTYQVKSQMANQAIPVDLINAQSFYENQITTKIERIKSLDANQNMGDTSLWQLFGKQDEEYDRIKEALRENPGNAHVRAAFVEYYRSRISVLNQIEQHLEARNSLKK